MQNVKSMMLSLLLVPLLVAGQTGEVSAKGMPGMLLPTDNGSTNVEIVIENAVVEDNQFTIDQPRLVTFSLKFTDSITDEQLEHVNYKFAVTDTNGNMIFTNEENHVHDGTNAHSMLFTDTGSFTLTIEVEGTGAPPYDTAHTGTVSSSVAVTPEFPLSVMVILAAVAGIGVVAGITNKTRYGIN